MYVCRYGYRCSIYRARDIDIDTDIDMDIDMDIDIDINIDINIAYTYYI